MKKVICFAVLVIVSAVSLAAWADDSQKPVTSPYTKWEKGPSHSKDFFPITVWLQDPVKAEKYQAAGFNAYIGLWQGPTEQQLAQLKKAGMKVICEQNEVGLKHVNDPIIIGWLQMDEPDNAQARTGGGYGPPVTPEKIVARYEKMRKADPSRPVHLGLGQGVAWDNWHGRGVRTNCPEDYPEYIKGGDTISFDIYPACHSNAQVAGKLWYVARGVERLKVWARDKIVWDCIECTRIGNAELKKATPHQVKSEVWMSIIHGSMGLVYFVHEWQPKFNESAILDDAEMLAGVTAINRQITELAPVLNSSTIEEQATVSSSNENVPVAIMLKKYKDATYLFAVAMRDGKTDAIFVVNGLDGERKVEVLGENRTLTAKNGVFKDSFNPWDVHLYKIK